MFSVTQNGKPLDPTLYNWDEKTKTFSTNEHGLVLDFSDYYGVTFKTGHSCTFNTGSYCTFKTGSDCTFHTGSSCTFNTGDYCTFKTGYDCTFTTGNNCFIARWDVKGCTEIPVGKTIKLNGFEVKGYTIIEKPQEKSPSRAGKVVEIDGKKYKLVETA